jgi:hypothetical protein
LINEYSPDELYDLELTSEAERVLYNDLISVQAGIISEAEFLATVARLEAKRDETIRLIDSIYREMTKASAAKDLEVAELPVVSTELEEDTAVGQVVSDLSKQLDDISSEAKDIVEESDIRMNVNETTIVDNNSSESTDEVSSEICVEKNVSAQVTKNRAKYFILKKMRTGRKSHFRLFSKIKLGVRAKTPALRVETVLPSANSQMVVTMDKYEHNKRVRKKLKKLSSAARG